MKPVALRFQVTWAGLAKRKSSSSNSVQVKVLWKPEKPDTGRVWSENRRAPSDPRVEEYLH